MKKSLLVCALLLSAGLTLFAADDAFKAISKDVREAQKAKDWQKVVTLYQTALPDIAKAEQKVIALNSIANANQKLKKTDEALAAYDQIIAMKEAPENARMEAMGNKAALLSSEKRQDEALKLYQQMLAETKLPAHQSTAHNAIAKTAMQSKKYDDALESYKKVVALEGLSSRNKANAYLQLAKLYNNQLKNDAEAEKAYKMAMEHGKGTSVFLTASSELAKFYLKTQRYADAEALLKQALSDTSLSAGWIITFRKALAEVYIADKKTNEAILQFDEAAKADKITDKQKEEIELAKIDALIKLGEYSKANTDIDAVLTRTTDPTAKVRLLNKKANNCFMLQDYSGATAALDQAQGVTDSKAKADNNLRKKIEKTTKAPVPQK